MKILRYFIFCIVLVVAVPSLLYTAQAIYIQGRTGELVDVVLDSGVRKLAVLATTVVEQIFGKDPNASTWFFFGATLEDAGGIGAAGTTVRVQIPAAVSPLNTIYPAVDVTYTVTSGDVASSNPERTVALNVCAALEANSNFDTAKWDCNVAKDFAYVHVVNKLFNEFGERAAYTVTCTGATVCSYGFTDIKRRGKETELSRSPNDPARLGTLAVSGSVSVTAGSISDTIEEYLMNGSSSDMRVNGSSVNVNFDYLADSSGNNARTRYITQIRCFGGGSGIQFTKFLSQNAALTNGLFVTIISDGITFNFKPIKKTEDFKNLFASTPNVFKLDVQSGSDQVIATFAPTSLIPLMPNSSDKIRATMRDNLASGIVALECLVFGFQKEG